MNFCNLKLFSFQPQFWRSKNLWSCLLFPFSLVYLLAVKFHNLLYQLRLKKTHYFSVPVMVVGNVTVGGTGKTPLVITLANFFVLHGYRPGIVSRGYGGKNQEPSLVTDQSDVEQVGDEALVIVRRTQCPLVISHNRAAAAAKLINEYNCNLVISDDGLQHYALGRTVEIAVIDGENRWGNGWCVPAGPLREPLSRLQQVDFIVVNSSKSTEAQYTMRTVVDQVYRLASSEVCSITEFVGQKIHAVAGIGNPQRFFNFLRSFKLDIIEHPFPDHYRFRSSDLDFADDLPIIMTEKDAVKCESFPLKNVWVVKISAELDNHLVDALMQAVLKSKQLI